MIQLAEVEKVYRTDRIETLALSNINLSVDKGEFISVMGPSGSGKSTLLNVIGLLDEPTAGDSQPQRATHQHLRRPATSPASATRRSVSSSRPST